MIKYALLDTLFPFLYNDFSVNMSTGLSKILQMFNRRRERLVIWDSAADLAFVVMFLDEYERLRADDWRCLDEDEEKEKDLEGPWSAAASQKTWPDSPSHLDETDWEGEEMPDFGPPVNDEMDFFAPETNDKKTETGASAEWPSDWPVGEEIPWREEGNGRAESRGPIKLGDILAESREREPIPEDQYYFEPVEP